jgi:NTE family protein
MDRSLSPTAFVLSGGGSLGAIQVGMLSALYERDIRPDLIVATSVGAINGAFVASRTQTTVTADELAAIWRKTRRGLVFPVGLRDGLRGFLGARAHLVPDSGLREIVCKQIGPVCLEDLAIPLHVVAVDVVTGEEILLSSGSAVEAVMASTAIPAVLPPVPWQDRVLMDGAIANNTPISHAIGLGARTVYVLPAGHACALERPPRTALGMALHALSLLTHSRLIADIELHRNSAKLVVLPPPCPLSISPIDFAHAEELVECALRDAREFLDEGGAERPPIRMRMHRHAHQKRLVPWCERLRARRANARRTGMARPGGGGVEGGQTSC